MFSSHPGSASDLSRTEQNQETDLEFTNTLFIPFLGQSNAEFMSYIYDPYQPDSIVNNTSGAIALEQKLATFTDQKIIFSNTQENNFDIGSSKVNGNSNGNYIDDDIVWWYPDQNLPGGALRQSESRLQAWLSTQKATINDEIAIIWSQGESDVGDLSSNDPIARDKYKQSTIAVFDYLTSRLDFTNVKFYMVPTGRLQTDGARNVGLSGRDISAMNEGLKVVREVQSEIALEREDVLLTPDYSDLNMVYEEGQLYGESYDQGENEWSQDFWHLGHDSLKIHGDRLAQYIALDQGNNNVISFTDSLGNPAKSTSLTRTGILDINIAKSSSQEIIQGTDNPDVVVGTLAEDEIVGGNGNDVIIATQGLDTLTGGKGNDVFFYDAAIYQDTVAHTDQILDFTIDKDRLDVSELIKLADNPLIHTITTEYITVNVLSKNSLEIQFDQDGVGQKEGATFAILKNIDPSAFISNIGNHLIVSPLEL